MMWSMVATLLGLHPLTHCYMWGEGYNHSHTRSTSLALPTLCLQNIQTSARVNSPRRRRGRANQKLRPHNALNLSLKS